MAKTATAKTQKTVSVIAVYKFTKVARICFEVLSSDEVTRYHTCFSNDENHSSCTCPGGESPRKKCYHQDQLRTRAAEYFDSLSDQDETPGLVAAEKHLASLKAQAARNVAILTPEGIAVVHQSEVTKHDILAAPLNGQAHKMEVAPSGRLVPMR